MSKGNKTGGRDFQPGQSGNPNGRPALPADIRAARQLRQEILEQRGNKYLFMAKEKLVAKWKSQKTSGIDLMLIGIILKGAKGDVNAINFIADRFIGKVKTVVEVSAPHGAPMELILGKYTPEELAKRKAEILAKAAKGK